MSNTTTTQSGSWFTGVPKVYALCNALPRNYLVLGSHNDTDYYSFSSGSKHYVARGQLTASGKGFKYMTLQECTSPVDTLESAVTIV